jgi:hypothetical protein
VANWGTIPIFACSEWGKLLETSIRTSDVWAKNLTRHFRIHVRRITISVNFLYLRNQVDFRVKNASVNSISSFLSTIILVLRKLLPKSQAAARA